MISTIEEKLETPVSGNYDVIVVGAGPAGCGAALSCAMNGAKTLLVDKFNCLGGMWTTGFMNPMFDYKNKTGLLKKIVDELKEYDAWGGFWDMSFNYEYMKCILDSEMEKNGVDVLLNTSFSKTLVDGNTVYGAVFENMDGRFACLAKNVIDCTGDGNVAASAGCPFDIGEDKDYTKCQAMTLMFLVGNISEKYKDGVMLYERMEAAFKKANKELKFIVPYLIPAPNTHYGVIQYTHMYEYNPLSQREVNAATVEGRKQMLEAFEVLKKYDDDFKDLELIASSGVLGVRESRRIIGEYTLTKDDLLSGRQFEDSVADATFGVDMHTKANKGQECFKVEPYQIPLRCLIPKGYTGIYVAGRCISGDRIAMASYRVTGNCFQMGEGLGKYLADQMKKA